LISFDEPPPTIRSEHSSWSRRVRGRRRIHHQVGEQAPTAHDRAR
jgi:hypothetical protein